MKGVTNRNLDSGTTDGHGDGTCCPQAAEDAEFLQDAAIVAALRQCVAAAVPSAGARSEADAALKAALATQLQRHSQGPKVPAAWPCPSTLHMFVQMPLY